MKKQAKPTVAVLFGGRGVERDISIVGGDYVLKHIDRERFRVFPVKITENGEWLLLSEKKKAKVMPVMRRGYFGLLSRRRLYRIDAVFPMLHGDFGEDGRLQGLLETLGAKFVGCKTHAGALASDKCFTKALADAVGIPTLPWLTVTEATKNKAIEEAEERLGYPMFVKPAGLGSSIGVGIAQNRSELEDALGVALGVGEGRAIVETYLAAPTELECAFLSIGHKKLVTSPGKVVSSGAFYSFDEKYSDKSATVSAIADIDESTARDVRTYALRICELIGVRSLARIDFFLSQDGKLYFNEINTMPGMTDASLYPLMLKTSGIEAADFINCLIEDALGDTQ